jgi:hypothetical protein
MTHGRILRAAGAIVLTLAIAACGSSSSGLSKSELAAKTNAICSKYSAKVRTVQQPADLLQNHVSAAHFFGQISALYDQALDQFRALKPESSVKAQWNDAVSKFAALDNLVRELKTKAEHADRSGIALLSQIKPLTTAANTAAAGIGATKCGSS